MSRGTGVKISTDDNLPAPVPLRLKMRMAHSTDVAELETHQLDASAANRALELMGHHIATVPHRT